MAKRKGDTGFSSGFLARMSLTKCIVASSWRIMAAWPVMKLMYWCMEVHPLVKSMKVLPGRPPKMLIIREPFGRGGSGGREARHGT